MEHSGPRMWAWVRIPLLTEVLQEPPRLEGDLAITKSTSRPRQSTEPDLNQRPKDTSVNLYSPPLYQLSYRWLGEDHCPRHQAKASENSQAAVAEAGMNGVSLLKKFACSRGWFRSTDLWVMGPARFLCATLLRVQSDFRAPAWTFELPLSLAEMQPQSSWPSAAGN